MSDQRTEPSSFSGLLRQALGDRLDPAAEDFLSMMAPDGVMEFPYAPAGYVTRVEGREALAGYLSRVGGLLAFDRVTGLVVHETRDPGVVILEFACEGRGVETGLPYDQRYVSVITVRDGLIVRYQDYWNPLTLLSAVGGIDALNAAMRPPEP